MPQPSDMSEAEFWQGLATNQGLGQDQLDQLRLVVDKIGREIEMHRANSAAPNGLTRRQRNDILRKICRSFEKLENQVAALTESGDRSLTPILAAFLAESLTNDGIERALGEGFLWPGPRIRDSEIRRGRRHEDLYSALEDHYRDRRHNIARHRAADLLQGFLRSAAPDCRFPRTRAAPEQGRSTITPLSKPHHRPVRAGLSADFSRAADEHADRALRGALRAPPGASRGGQRRRGVGGAAGPGRAEALSAANPHNRLRI